MIFTLSLESQSAADNLHEPQQHPEELVSGRHAGNRYSLFMIYQKKLLFVLFVLEPDFTK